VSTQTPLADRVTGDRLTGDGQNETRHTGFAVRPDIDMTGVKNRVQAMPIIAGILTALATLLILAVLGLAIGASAFEPREAGEKLGTSAAIWGVVSGLIAFFLGGWVAAKTAAVSGAGSGLINGLMVGAGVLALVLWLTGAGAAGLIGALGSNIGDITNIAQSQGTSVDEAQRQAQQVDRQQAFDVVKDSAWWTLGGLVLPLVAAGLGGLVGHNRDEGVI
jgi:heme A synthase